MRIMSTVYFPIDLMKVASVSRGSSHQCCWSPNSDDTAETKLMPSSNCFWPAEFSWSRLLSGTLGTKSCQIPYQRMKLQFWLDFDILLGILVNRWSFAAHSLIPWTIQTLSKYYCWLYDSWMSSHLLWSLKYSGKASPKSSRVHWRICDITRQYPDNIQIIYIDNMVLAPDSSDSSDPLTLT